MSGTEWRLWYHLRGRQLMGRKFRRQVPIGPYFADFACLDATLVVEVDGDHHGDQLAYDARRDHRLSELGFRVLRFSVAEIDENFAGVVEAIADALGTSGRPPTNLPPPAGGGLINQLRLDRAGDGIEGDQPGAVPVVANRGLSA